MWFLRPDESKHKLFYSQFLFGTNILIEMYKQTNFGYEWKMRISATNSSFGSKEKMSQFSQKIFQLSLNFLADFLSILQQIKSLD